MKMREPKEDKRNKQRGLSDFDFQYNCIEKLRSLWISHRSHPTFTSTTSFILQISLNKLSGFEFSLFTKSFHQMHEISVHYFLFYLFTLQPRHSQYEYHLNPCHTKKRQHKPRDTWSRVQQSRFRVVGERVERWRTMFHDKNPYKRTSSNYIQVQFNLAWEITTTVIGHRSATERRYVMQDRQRPNVQHLWDHVLVCAPTGQNKVAHRTAWSRNREEINRRLDLMLTLNYKLGIIKSWKKERLVPNVTTSNGCTTSY